MRAPVAKRRAVDPTIYPEEERVGEDLLQRWIVELLRPLLQWWLTRRGVRALVGADQFIYWRQHDPHARVAPDIYVLPGVDPRTRVRTWKIWLDRVAPSFALEVVSQDWEKDYAEVIQRYDELEAGEVLVFDPGYAEHPEGLRWQVFRRIGKRGLVRVEATSGVRVRSKALGCWFCAVGEGRDTRIRIAEGAHGDNVVPTAEEREAAERAAKEAERAEKEAERLAKEAAHAEKEAALARVRELEDELRRLKRKRRH